MACVYHLDSQLLQLLTKVHVMLGPTHCNWYSRVNRAKNLRSTGSNSRVASSDTISLRLHPVTHWWPSWEPSDPTTERIAVNLSKMEAISESILRSAVPPHWSGSADGPLISAGASVFMSHVLGGGPPQERY